MNNIAGIEEYAKSFFQTEHPREEPPINITTERAVSFEDMSRCLYFPPLKSSLLYE